MNGSKAGTNRLDREGCIDDANSVLKLLAQERWCTQREIEDRLSISPLRAANCLRGLEAQDQVFLAWVPEVDDPPIRMWHRTTGTIREISPAGLNMTWLPLRMKQDYLKKVSRLLLTRRIPRGVPDWIFSASRIEQHLANARLYHMRARPSQGFLYRCAWHANRGNERFTFIPAERRYYFSVGFIGTIKDSLTLPPLDTRTDGEGSSETAGWLGDDGCEYTAMACQVGTTILLTEVARISVDAHHGVVHAPSTDELVGETSRKLQAGAEEWPLLSMFLPMPKYKFELLARHDNSEKASES